MMIANQIPRAATEISDEELQEMIREAIYQGMRADIAGRAMDWFDRVSDLLFALRAEMPEVLASAGP